MEEKEKNVPLLLTLSFKKCTCCGEVKPTTEFTRHKNHEKWGFHSYCKECATKKIRSIAETTQRSAGNCIVRLSLRSSMDLQLKMLRECLKNKIISVLFVVERYFYMGLLWIKLK